MQSKPIFHLASRMTIPVLIFISIFAMLHASCLPNDARNTNQLCGTNETNPIAPQSSIGELESKNENENKILVEELENEEKLSEDESERNEKEGDSERDEKEGDSERDEKEDEYVEVRVEEEQEPNNTEVEEKEVESEGSESDNDLLAVTNKNDDNSVDEFQLVTACSGELGEVIFLDDNGLDDSEVMNQE